MDPQILTKFNNPLMMIENMEMIYYAKQLKWIVYVNMDEMSRGKNEEETRETIYIDKV